jgi:hypothetical protein
MLEVRPEICAEIGICPIQIVTAANGKKGIVPGDLSAFARAPVEAARPPDNSGSAGFSPVGQDYLPIAPKR